MDQKKEIMISCTVCAVIIAIVICAYYWMETGREGVRIAQDSSQIELFVEFSSETERINIWEDDEGDYYFFLPSGALEHKITFGNLGKNDSIYLNEQIFSNKDDLRELLKEYISLEKKLVLTMKIGGAEQESINVRFLQSENIPAMFVDTESETLENILTDKGNKEAAVMRLWDSEGNNCYNDSLEYIKGRGNSTWEDYDKKPFQIKLNREAGLLNMPTAKKWILLANILDDTLMKNEIIFHYAEKYTTVPSIEGRFVDLYVNGDYFGNYYLCEKVEVSDNRLNITDLEAATEKVNRKNNYDESSLYISENGCIKATQGLDNPADITGGYLLENIPLEEYEEATNAFRTDMGYCYVIKSPSPATVEQAEYICGLFNEAEAAISEEDGINPETGKHISEYFNLDSWASKYVMEVVFHDPDATDRSMYMYKDSDSIDPLLYSGPMWDYDRAIGSYGAQLYRIDDPKQIRECGIYGDELMTFAEVKELVYEKFEKDMIPYIENKVQADIYELDQQIRDSAELDLIRWNKVYGYYVNRNISVEYLTYFLKEKKDYLKNIWLGEKDYCTVIFQDYYGNDYKIFHVKKGESIIAPSIANYGEIFAGWYVKGQNIPYEPQLPVLEDVIYESRWIDVSTILKNTIDMQGIDLLQVDPTVFEDMADAIRKMQEENIAVEAEP